MKERKQMGRVKQTFNLPGCNSSSRTDLFLF